MAFFTVSTRLSISLPASGSWHHWQATKKHANSKKRSSVPRCDRSLKIVNLYQKLTYEKSDHDFTTVPQSPRARTHQKHWYFATVPTLWMSESVPSPGQASLLQM
jgi:hypothetical protein